MKGWLCSIASVRLPYVSSPRSPLGGGPPVTRTQEHDAAPSISSAISRAVVLLHGPGGSSHESTDLELALRQHGFFVVTPSLEGLHDRTPHLFWRWILDSLTEIHRLAVTHREINLCGVSHGAALALAVAAERPIELDSLALISPRIHLGGSTMLSWPLHVPMSQALANWRVLFRRRPEPGTVKQEGAKDAVGHIYEEHSLAAGSVVSSTQLREARRLTRYVEGALERVHAPTLIIHTWEDAALLRDLRYIQVHIGSQFKEVFLESEKGLITHHVASERTALKIVEFFNEVARRRALAAMVRR